MQLDNNKITVRIKGVRDFEVHVDTPESLKEVEEAQNIVNYLLSSWQDDPVFNGYKEKDLMGMLAFRLARFYYKSNKTEMELQHLLDSCNKELEDLILKVDQ